MSIKDLKREADDLGVKYSPNIGVEKLQEKITSFYGSKETLTERTEAAISDPKQPDKEVSLGWTDADRRKLSKDREAEARKTRIVTIIDNDSRVNNQTTTCHATCGNAYFDLGGVVLPLNMEVQVHVGHINSLKGVMIPMHVKDHKTGLCEYVLRSRYTISYSDKVVK